MTILRLTDVHKSYGPHKVLDGFSLHMIEGERVGLIGANGTGKTTILRMIAGTEAADDGEIQVTSGLRVGLFTQMVELPPDESVLQAARDGLDYVHALDRRIHELSNKLAAATGAAEIERLSHQHDELVREFERHDGYMADVRVETILTRFGFTRDDFNRPLREFSGGWQKRVALARLLVAEPDVLLLDEPTNHLDADTTQWLEGLLGGYQGTMLLVTHDRYFLDNIVTRIVELENGTGSKYAGNYSDYLEEKARRFEMARRTYDRQQELIEHEREYIARVHYGLKHKQAASRQKRLDKMDQVDRPRDGKTYSYGFKPSARLGDLVLEAGDLHKAYDRELLGGLSLGLSAGERLGIIGPNGCGKSTLVSILVGKLAPDNGVVRLGTNTRVAFHDQELDEIASDETLFDVIRHALPERCDKLREKVLSVLGQFLFTEARAEDIVGHLSGGERARLLLARMSVTQPNLLIFDEPTNNLDIQSIRVLEEAILSFSGAVIAVSHDRYFLDRIAGTILAFEGGRTPKLYPGNYQLYLYQKQEAEREAAGAAEARASAQKAAQRAAAVAADASVAKQRGRNVWKIRKAIEQLEAEIHGLEARLKSLTETMNDKSQQGNSEALRSLGYEYRDVDDKLKRCYAEWERLAGEIEAQDGAEG